jgi:hypothetical protein
MRSLALKESNSILQRWVSKKSSHAINGGTLFICSFAGKILVNLRVTRVETFFGELEYIEARLRAIYVV